MQLVASQSAVFSLADIPALLDDLHREKFYGRVSFDLRDGEVSLIRTERTELVSSGASSNSNQGAGIKGE
jgi:hypothetical protein